jgi:hypothetical protein
LLFQLVRKVWATQQAHKDRLQHVLSIRGVAGDPVRGAEDQAMVRAKNPFEFLRNRDCRFLYQYALQVTPPLAPFHK